MKSIFIIQGGSGVGKTLLANALKKEGYAYVCEADSTTWDGIDQITGALKGNDKVVFCCYKESTSTFITDRVSKQDCVTIAKLERV